MPTNATKQKLLFILKKKIFLKKTSKSWWNRRKSKYSIIKHSKTAPKYSEKKSCYWKRGTRHLTIWKYHREKSTLTECSDNVVYTTIRKYDFPSGLSILFRHKQSFFLVKIGKFLKLNGPTHGRRSWQFFYSARQQIARTNAKQNQTWY